MLDVTLPTYIAAVFGEDCQHHFGKLHRFCEVGTLTDELLDELCENLFTQVSLAGETKINKSAVNLLNDCCG